MKFQKIRLVILFFSVLCSYGLLAQNKAAAKERFAGLHFDFHANLNDSGIGKTFTAAMIDSLLTIVKPDFIQVDCKGHAGISSYPTKVGIAAPAIDKDILKIWREVTAKHHIPLYVHYSGVWDFEQLIKHPDWARLNADGTADKNATSVFSAYEDSLLIPQIKELALDYKLDGIWVDGDCWTLGNDYSAAAVAAFAKETGIAKPPQKAGDADYFEWVEFNRKAFRNYIAKYVNATHAVAPNFKITSNWSFSSLMPEPVSVPVDYLSGDVAGINCVYSSAFESRCLAFQGKPWDLMSWSFTAKNNAKATKSLTQMQQEAAEVMALGGGFQTYWQQNRDGTPEPYQFRKMADMVKFCNDRKAFTFKGETVPQIGLLYSGYAWKRINSESLYTAHGQDGIKGILNILLDSQLPIDILMDHQLNGRMDKYPLLIIPEWKHIDSTIRIQLLSYVKNGGNLLVIGAEAVQDYKEELGVTTTQSLEKDKSLVAGFNKRIVIMPTNYQPVNGSANAEKFGVQLTADDWRFATDKPLATVVQYGKGKIGGVYMDMGGFYNHNVTPFSAELLQAIIKEMVPAFTSTVIGSKDVHQVVTRNNGKLYIHLINSGGAHNNPNVLVYDSVPQIKNLTVQVKLAKAPKNILLQPGNNKAVFQYKNGAAVIKISAVNVYSIVEIQE